jgi:hypothetical protein
LVQKCKCTQSVAAIWSRNVKGLDRFGPQIWDRVRPSIQLKKGCRLWPLEFRHARPVQFF